MPVFSSGKPNPYVGLRPFELADAQYFFGRDGQVDPMVDLLARHRFLGVVGVSGSGKSSLVRAGLLPALHAGMLPTGMPEWVVVEMKPRSQPIQQLAEALARSPILAGASQDLGPLEEFAETALRHSSGGLVELARQGLAGERKKNQVSSSLQTRSEGPLETSPSGSTIRGKRNFSLLLLVDQFEEIFRFARLGAAAEAEHFIQLLLTAADQTTMPVYVVLTMRSDFLGDCARFRGLPEHLNASQYIIPRLERKDLRMAIEGPAKLMGVTVEPALVTRLLNDLGEEPNRLPLLQHALRRMWDFWVSDKMRQLVAKGNSEDFSANLLPLPLYLDQVGTLDGDPSATEEHLQHGALHRHAQEVYESMPEDEREKVEMLFKALTELAPDNRSVRRPETAGVLAALLWPSMPENEALETLSKLTLPFRDVQAGFLTPASPPHLLRADTSLDISHEALISQWHTLKEWVKQEAEDARQLRRLVDDEERRWRYDDEQYEKVRAWWERRAPGSAWTDRYVPGKWDSVVNFYEAEHAAASRRDMDRKAKECVVRQEAKLRRLALLGMMASSTAVAVLSFSLFIQTRDAGRVAAQSLGEVQKSLTNSFVWTIGRDGAPDEEWNALWELATLKTDNEAVRGAVLDHWFKPGGMPRPALKKRLAGLKSARGLVVSRISYGDIAEEVGRDLITPANSREVVASSEIYSLAKRLDKSASAKLAGHVVDSMRENLPQNFSNPSKMVFGLVALFDRMDQELAAPIADDALHILLQSLRKDAGASGFNRDVLVEVTKVASCLSQSGADSHFKIAIEGLGATQEPSSPMFGRHDDWGFYLALLSGVIQRQGGAGIRHDQIKTVLQVLMKDDGYPGKQAAGVSALLSALGKVNIQLDSEETREVRGQLELWLKRSMTEIMDSNDLSEILLAISQQLSIEDRSEFALEIGDILLKDLKTRYFSEESWRYLLKMLSLIDSVSLERNELQLAKTLSLIDSQVLDISSIRYLKGPVAIRAASMLEALVWKSMESAEVELVRRAEAYAAIVRVSDTPELQNTLRRIGVQLIAQMQGPNFTEVQLCRYSRSFRAITEGLGDKSGVSILAKQATQSLLAVLNTKIEERDPEEFLNLNWELVNLTAMLSGNESVPVNSKVAESVWGKVEVVLPGKIAQIEEKGVPIYLENVLLAALNGLGKDAAQQYAQKAWKKLWSEYGEGRSPFSSDYSSARTFRSLLLGFAKKLSRSHVNARLVSLELVLDLELTFIDMGRYDDDASPPPDFRSHESVKALCKQLDTETLVEMLKWPSCRGEAEVLILEELESRLGARFGGSVDKFVEIAPGLGISNLSRPPVRPEFDEAEWERNLVPDVSPSKDGE